MLDRVCPIYMAAGISYDEFWHGDYTRLKYEMKAYRLRLNERNREMWIQGYYVYDAVSTAIYNAFKERGKPPADYRKEPIRIDEMTEEEKAAESEKTLENFKAQLMALTGRLEKREKERVKEADAKKKVEAMIYGS